MRYSENWKNWIANIDEKTCNKCRGRHGKIYSTDEIVDPSPPLHPNCKCVRIPMEAIVAGTATNFGTNGADWWIKYLQELPEYYITRDDAKNAGWVNWKGNLADVLPGAMIYGGIYYNDKGILPHKEGRVWYETDINYEGGYRNSERVVFSNDGLIFVTYDHYKTFAEIIGEEN